MKLKQLVPDFLKLPIQKVLLRSRDLTDRLKYKGMIPPRSMNYVGDGVYLKIGLEFKRYFLNIANLKPDEKILDVGSGMGRMAVPLTKYLSDKGEYWGFDIVERGIDWCRKKITPRVGNFHFLHSDVYSKHYNPKGTIPAREYKFPFENNYFDFVFLTSVFTHMLPLDLENYLSEISRVLKPGGRSIITYFILNRESEQLVSEGQTTLDFRFTMQDGCKTTTEKDPEAAIAYREEFIDGLYSKHNMKIEYPIRFGSWCKRRVALSYQDIIFAVKN
jgi:ubiquinone/menaquinone biosynthesis C-methylase UbiE